MKNTHQPTGRRLWLIPLPLHVLLLYTVTLLTFAAASHACSPAYHWLHIANPEYGDTIHVRIHYYGNLHGGEDDVMWAPQQSIRLLLVHPGTRCDAQTEQDIMHALGYSGSFITAIVYPGTSGKWNTEREALSIKKTLDSLCSRLTLPMAEFYGVKINAVDFIGYSEGCSAAIICAAMQEHAEAHVPAKLTCIAPLVTNQEAWHMARTITMPSFILCADTDCIAPVAQHAWPLYDSLSAAKKMLITLKGADHCNILFTTCTDSTASCTGTLSSYLQLQRSCNAIASFLYEDLRDIWSMVKDDSLNVLLRTTMKPHYGSRIVVSKDIACRGDSILLKTDPPDVYLWLPDSVRSTELHIMATRSTIYSIVEEDFGVAHSTVHISVAEPRLLGIWGKTVLCDNDTAQLIVVHPPGMGPAQWSTGVVSDTIRLTQTGVVSVRLFDSLCCAWSEQTVALQSKRFTLIVQKEAPDYCHFDSTVWIGVPSQFSPTDYVITMYDGDNLYSSGLAPGQHLISALVTRRRDGCVMTSDTVRMTISDRANPEDPIISRLGNILRCSEADAYQWEFNGQLISGATEKSVIISDTGQYRVNTFFHGLSCHKSSDYAVTNLPVSDVDGISSQQNHQFIVVSDGTLTLSRSEPVEDVCLTSLTGQIVLQAAKLEAGERLDCTRLSAGCYSVRYSLRGTEVRVCSLILR